MPFSVDRLKNRFFDSFNIKTGSPILAYVKDYLARKGITIDTIDYWRPEHAKPDDVLVVFDHPPVGMWSAIYTLSKIFSRFSGAHADIIDSRKILNSFSRKVLFNWESPVNKPWLITHAQDIRRLYDAAYAIPSTSNYTRFYYPERDWRSFTELFEVKKEKFLVMMNTRKRAKGYFPKELYTKRVDAAKFFARYREIDIYGAGWDRSGSPDIRAVQKGIAEDKHKTLSHYKFTLCFENTVWPEYVTEKIFECMMVGTVPVYWGAPDISHDVPPECYIDMRVFKNYEDLRRFLHSLAPKEIERYRMAAREYFRSPAFERFTYRNFAVIVERAIRGA